MLKPHAILLNDEPGDTGATPAPADTAAPAAAPPPAAPEPTAAPAAPAPSPAPAEPVDPSKGIMDMLDKIGKPEEAPKPTAAPAPAAAPAAKPGEKKDEFDYTPPEGMADRAKERWSSLTERAKQVPELERRATEATTALDSVRRMVNDSGVNAEEFGGILDLARLVKSTNAQEAQQALQRLDTIRAEIAGRLGIEVPGVDQLAAHPDLKAEVDAMTLTKERALEIAALRTKGRHADALTTDQREQVQFRQTVNDAATSMERTLATRAGTPGHQEKLNYIGSLFKDPAKLQTFVATYQPHQWEHALLSMYDAYQPPAPRAPAVPQPLRPGSTTAGTPSRSGPVTVESAVSGAFERLGL